MVRDAELVAEDPCTNWMPKSIGLDCLRQSLYRASIGVVRSVWSRFRCFQTNETYWFAVWCWWKQFGSVLSFRLSKLVDPITQPDVDLLDVERQIAIELFFICLLTGLYFYLFASLTGDGFLSISQTVHSFPSYIFTIFIFFPVYYFNAFYVNKN